MRFGRASRMLAAVVLVLQSGCTAMREIPRSQYAEQPVRRDIVVRTSDGRKLEFEEARFVGDTLLGYNRSEQEEDAHTLVETRLSLDDVTRIAKKGVDWRQTAIIGGLAVLGVAGYALTRPSSDKPAPTPPPKPPPTLSVH